MVCFPRTVTLVLVLVFFGSCAHAPPQLAQVFGQVNQVFDPAQGSWTPRLSVFVQASSSDGTKVFDRLYLIHDGQGLEFTLDRSQWTQVDRPGETWLGANGLAFAGAVPTGTWRALLVTRDGQRVESSFEVPPQPPDAPPFQRGPVTVKPDPQTPGRFRVFGWTDDYLVWALDPKGTVLTRAKTSGPEFTVPEAAGAFVLYSYDKGRGEGWEAGPFPVQASGKPADR